MRDARTLKRGSMDSAFFSDLLTSIAERGRSVLKLTAWPRDADNRAGSLADMCGALLTGRGEASGVALASEILARYRGLSDADKGAFFRALADDFGPDRQRVEDAVARWSATRGESAASEIHYASEPRRQELFRRLNRAPGGTAALVAMRADLLEAMRDDRGLAVVDRDFQHLFGSWFNRGFLVLRRIDWSSPAAILEKIIRYEAVHEIRDWDDLRRRIDPDGPALLRLLSPGAGRRAADLRRSGADPGAAGRDRAAARRAAGACRAGQGAGGGLLFDLQLPAGPLGRHLRQFPHQAGGRGDPPRAAAHRDLRHAVAGPRLSRLGRGLRRPGGRGAGEGGARDRARRGWPGKPDSARGCARRSSRWRLIIFSKRGAPTAGSSIRSRASISATAQGSSGSTGWATFRRKGLAESYGVMVNYLYDLAEIERNHEAYANQGAVVASSAVKKLLPSARRARAAPALPAPRD